MQTGVMRGALVGVGLALAIPAHAQDSQDSQEIVVTGHGLDQSATYARELDDRQLTDTGSERIEDALRNVADLDQFRRSDSRSAHPTSQGVTIRGLGGNAASRLLVLLDGVPQADPFGGWVAFPAYLSQRLSSARVTRGGGSGYAGPGAEAGTIELASGNPDELGRLQLGLDYGSRDSLNAFVVGGTKLAPGFVTVAGQYADRKSVV